MGLKVRITVDMPSDVVISDAVEIVKDADTDPRVARVAATLIELVESIKQTTVLVTEERR